jgi:glyoxylase-like metal-dependent hydrolase (beta-lactamase superfamily II)
MEGHPGCIVIDPGGWENKAVKETALGLAEDVNIVLLTHEHFDHVGGLFQLLDHWAFQVVCSRECAAGIADPMRNFSRYLVNCDVACAVNPVCWEEMNDGLSWNNIEIRYISTPGHSPGSVCISIDNLLFSGDTLMWGRKRAIVLPGGNKRELEQSLNLLFRTFPPDTQVYPGHGKPFLLGQAMALETARYSVHV